MNDYQSKGPRSTDYDKEVGVRMLRAIDNTGADWSDIEARAEKKRNESLETGTLNGRDANRKRRAILATIAIAAAIVVTAAGAMASGLLSSDNHRVVSGRLASSLPQELSSSRALIGAPQIALNGLRSRAAKNDFLPSSASLALASGDRLSYGISADSYWLDMPIRVVGSPPATLGQIWRATLLVGELRDIMAWSHDSPLGGATVIATSDDGTRSVVYDGTGSGSAVAQVFAVSNANNAKSLVESNARDAGLTIVSLRIVDMLQPAPEVVVSIQSAENWIKTHNVESLLFGAGNGYFEGYHVEIRDAATGAPIYADAWCARLGTSTTWYANPPKNEEWAPSPSTVTGSG